MAWLRESDNTVTQEGILRAYDFEDIQLLIKNEREFMQPEDFHGELNAEEKLKLRKQLLLKIARKEMMDSVRCAMEILEEYAEDLIKITAPREKVIDGEVKTYQGWEDSGMNFDEYVKEGDMISYDLVMYFAECVPPRTFDSGFIQCGEPADTVIEGFRYASFIYLYDDEPYKEVWQYKGKCLGGCCDKGTEIPRV